MRLAGLYAFRGEVLISWTEVCVIAGTILLVQLLFQVPIILREVNCQAERERAGPVAARRRVV